MRIPQDVAEAGVSAGDSGVIAIVWDGDGMLDVEMPKDDETYSGFVDPEVSPDGGTRVVGYSKLAG